MFERTESLLKVDSIEVGYGTVTALDGVGLSVDKGEAVAVVGANGAGKSTLLNTIIGFLDPSRGHIHFRGTRINGMPPERRSHLGLGYCPEGRHVFPGMTSRENLEVASWAPPRERNRLIDEIYEIFPQLAEKENAPGWQLSGGQQQMLAIGRALMGRPRLLLLDEPSLGLSPILVSEVLRQVRRIVEQGTAVLLAEQNVAKALQICDRAYVLQLGRVMQSGSTAGLRDSADVKKAFLGG